MRVLNRLVALLVGLALIAVGGLALAETAAAFAGRPPLVVPRDVWAQTLASMSWEDATLVTIAAVLIAAGLLLLILQLIPRAPTAYAISNDSGADRDISVDRKGLQERVRRVVLDDADVVNAKVKLTKKKAQVRAALLPDANRNQAASRINEAVSSEFTNIGLARPLRPAVSAMQAQERVR